MHARARHRWEAMCIFRSTYCIYIDILLQETKTINTEIYILLEQLRMNNMQRTSAIKFLQSWASMVFIFITVRVSLSLSYLNNLFLWRYDSEFDINVYFIAPENLFHPCKIDRKSYGVRLIFYNASWAPYDIVRCPAGHRPMLSYTDAGRRPYDRWPRKKNYFGARAIIKFAGDVQIAEIVRCQFICDHSITVILCYDKQNNVRMTNNI